MKKHRSRYSFDEAKIARFIREGRGQGAGADYQPWLRVSDVPSIGRSHRFQRSDTNREHHLFSDNENHAFLSLAWDSSVIDLREQFPLKREETLEIAQELGIRHPIDYETKIPIVMCTDILATYLRGGVQQLHAYSVTKDKVAKRIRANKVSEIERTYWERRNVPWDLILGGELKTHFNRNLAWVFSSQLPLIWFSEKAETTVAVLTEFNDLTEKRSILTLAESCNFIDRHLDLLPGTALLIIRCALGRKLLLADFNCRSLLDLPVSQFSFGAP